MRVTIRMAFWGDHRGVQQHRAHDHIEQARWRWKVARNEARRAAARAPEFEEVPVFMRRQAE